MAQAGLSLAALRLDVRGGSTTRQHERKLAAIRCYALAGTRRSQAASRGRLLDGVLRYEVVFEL